MGMREPGNSVEKVSITETEINFTNMFARDGNSVLFYEGKNYFCIGMVDIVNSTKIAATLSTANLGKYYAVFLNTMASVAKRFGAKIVKNVGDSLLYYFTDCSNKGLENCLECCLTMIDANNILNKYLIEHKLPKLNYRVSLDYGQTVIAKSENSYNDDIFGPPVNMCVKINHIANPNGIVIGGDLYQLVKKFTKYNFKQIESCLLGIKTTYPTYSLERKSDASSSFIKIEGETLLIANEDVNTRRKKIATAVQRTLLQLGRPEYELVTQKLETDYRSYLFDCYDNPEYLRRILKNLYGNAYPAIVGMIESELVELQVPEFQLFIQSLRR